MKPARVVTKEPDTGIQKETPLWKPRIVMSVAGANAGTLQFLDENGKVISSLPAAPSAPGK